MKRWKASLRAAAVVALCLVLVACEAPVELPKATLAITQVTVIDGVSDAPRADMSVLIDDAEIVAILPAAEVDLPADVEVVDGRGKFLIPGLWDAHVHLANVDTPPIAPEQQLAYYLLHGIVAVRDMGSDWQRVAELKRRVEAGDLRGPEIFAPGPFVDGPQEASAAFLPVAGPEEARAAVRSLKDQGVDFVKIQATLGRDSYFAAVDEAKKLGLSVHGHVPDALTAEEVSTAGQLTIEHASPALPGDASLMFSCSGREDELRQEHAAIGEARKQGDADPRELGERYRALQRALVETHDAGKAAALFATLQENSTRVVPTLIWSRSFSPFEQQQPADLPVDLLPTAEREKWQGILERYFAGASEERLALNRLFSDGATRLVGELHRDGVEILAGTDSPFGFVIPGFSLHQELEYLVEAGLTPRQALRAATQGPAELLAVGESRGTVVVGQRADLLLLDADPLADIRNTRKINAVLAAGDLYRRQDLDQMRAEIVAGATAEETVP